MSTEIIVAIIGAVAVITAAIINKKKKAPITKDKKRSVEFHQQKAEIQGDYNDIGQSMSGRGSQSATIKGDGNSINQKIN